MHARTASAGRGASAMDGHAVVVPQLTVRACVVGVLVGGLMCFSNMYFGLQTGWITAGSLQTTILGYGVFKLLRPWLDRSFGPLENVVLQTVAVATATMPLAGGFVGIVPAMAMLTPLQGGPVLLTNWELVQWSAAVAFFGAFVAVPLRRQTILREQLAFPSGTATAEIIKVLHGAKNDGDRSGGAKALAAELAELEMEPLVDNARVGTAPAAARFSDLARSDSEAATTPATTITSSSSGGGGGGGRGGGGVQTMEANEWCLLFWSFALSGGYTLLAHFVPILKNLPVLDWLGYPAATPWFWSLQPSLSYVGQGLIMGPRTTLSMLLGTVIGWAWLGPMARAEGWAPGPIGDSKTGAQGWLMWVSLAIMLSESLVSLGILTLTSTVSLIRQHGTAVEAAAEDELDPAPLAEQVPRSWWTGGLLISSLLCVLLVAPLFDMPWFEPAIAVAFSCVVSVLAVRALGETDLNPVSGIGKISQLLFALVAPGNVISNLVAGAISEGAAMAAGDLMQCLKCGHLVGASPRAQFIGQLIGTFASIGFSVAAWALYSSQYTITDQDPRLSPGETPDFPAPTAVIWLDMAELVNGGAVAQHVLPTCLIAGASVALLQLLQATTDESWCLRPLLPSGIALAIGMYVTPNWTIPRVIGGLTHGLWHWLAPAHARRYMVILASGFVLGEGIVAVLTAVLKAVGFGAAICWGCPVKNAGGFCGGCYINGTLIG